MPRFAGHAVGIAALAVALAAALAADASRAVADEAAREAAAFQQQFAPFLQQHCARCHSGDEPRGGASFDEWNNAEAVRGDLDLAESAIEMISSGLMPPEDEPRPDAAATQAAVTWLAAQVAAVDCSGERDPGRVTIRRLNRQEYRNTIRDLLAVSFDPTHEFPVDDSGYGYDTIGDVLTVSPLLMERYWQAAEKISEMALVAPEQLPAPKIARTAEAFEGGALVEGVGRQLSSQGAFTTTFQISQTGRYLLAVKAFGDQAGGEPARMAVEWDGERIKLCDVAAEADEPQVYIAQFIAEAGERRLELAFTNDYYNAKHPDRDERDRNLWIEGAELIGPLDEQLRGLPAAHWQVMPASAHYPAKADEVRRAIEKFALRAYRRPPTGEEIDRLMQLADSGERAGQSLEWAMRSAVQAVLVSPYFLFRGEMQEAPDDPRRVQPLDEFALAARMSYFLWSSMPDEALLQAAQKGELRQTLPAQVKRMLADAKAEAFVENFAGQWLQIRKLKDVQPDPQRFPQFNDELRYAMRRETELFFAALIREDRNIFNLIDARFTYLNEPLAKHYGIGGVKGNEFRRVELKDESRGGVLTQASILTLTSHPTRSSPVKRGAWILEQLLGDGTPPPPPDVPELEEQTEDAGATLRQRLEAHRAHASCAACHARIDPLGFALENFDAIGAWRDRDGAHPVDTRGVLPDGREVNGVAGLRKVLQDDPQRFRRTMTEQMLTYALGRGLEPSDRCAVNDITSSLAAEGDRFSSLVLAIINSPPFQLRRGEGAAP